MVCTQWNAKYFELTLICVDGHTVEIREYDKGFRASQSDWLEGHSRVCKPQEFASGQDRPYILGPNPLSDVLYHAIQHWLEFKVPLQEALRSDGIILAIVARLSFRLACFECAFGAGSVDHKTAKSHLKQACERRKESPDTFKDLSSQQLDTY